MCICYEKKGSNVQHELSIVWVNSLKGMASVTLKRRGERGLRDVLLWQVWMKWRVHRWGNDKSRTHAFWRSCWQWAVHALARHSISWILPSFISSSPSQLLMVVLSTKYNLGHHLESMRYSAILAKMRVIASKIMASPTLQIYPTSLILRGSQPQNINSS